MDKKTLEALSNFAYSLEELVDSMQAKADEEEKFGGLGGLYSKQQDLENTLVRISEGVEKIEESNKTIIDNQNELLKVSKDIKKTKESEGLLSSTKSGEGRAQIAKGVGTIVMIAGAVLAVGAAFKIIGNVDFASVIALSIAMPLVAYSFVKIAESMNKNGMGVGDIASAGLALVMMSAGVVGASYILQYTQTVGAAQLFSAIAIGITFVILSYAISNATKNLKGVGVGEVVMLPFVFVTLSTAVVASSYILGETQPIDGSTLMNVILQSLTLTIVASVMSIPMFVFKKMGLKVDDIFKGSLMIVMVAGAMALSSQLIALGNYDTYPSLDWAIGAGSSMLAMSLPVIAMGLLSMTGVGLVAIGLGSIATIMVAGTIMATSHILAQGNYANYPDASWAAGVGLSMVVFGTSMAGLGLAMISVFGGIALAAGVPAVLMTAHAIKDASIILDGGKYSGGPSYKWSLGVGMAIGAFSPVFDMIQRANVLSIFGGSSFSGEDYAKTIETISWSIVKAGLIFDMASSSFSGGPKKEWSEGVGMAIGAFAPVFKTLNSRGIIDSIFGGGVKIEEMDRAITTIASSIRNASDLFKGDEGTYTGGPKKEWAEGVGAALTGFSSVYTWIYDGFDYTPEHIKNGNVMIALMVDGIKDTAKSLKDVSTGSIPKPSKMKGISDTLIAFTEIYDFFFGGWGDYDIGYITRGNEMIFSIAKAISKTATYLEPLNDVDIPDANATSQIAKNLESWENVMEVAKNMDLSGLYRTAWAVKNLSGGVDSLANSMNYLTTVLGKFSEEQLATLNNVSGAFISLSIIDSQNFDEVLGILEDKSEAISEIFNKKQQQESSLGIMSSLGSMFGFGGGGKQESETTPTIRKESVEQADTRSIDDLYEMLSAMDAKLAQISSNSGNLSDYINELRTNNTDVSIK